MYNPRFNGSWMYPSMDWKEQVAKSEQLINDFAMDAYVYGFPLVLMDITRRRGLLSVAQMNRFYHQKELSTPQFTQVVRPNVDTLYSSAWLNLKDGPLLLHVPNTDNRYYLLPMLDAYSNVFASVGARTTGTDEQVFAHRRPKLAGSPSFEHSHNLCTYQHRLDYWKNSNERTQGLPGSACYSKQVHVDKD